MQEKAISPIKQKAGVVDIFSNTCFCKNKNAEQMNKPLL